MTRYKKWSPIFFSISLAQIINGPLLTTYCQNVNIKSATRDFIFFVNFLEILSHHTKNACLTAHDCKLILFNMGTNNIYFCNV